MERYEVRVKFEEIKRLTDNGDYYKAMEIADTVDWDRVKSLGMLCKVGEIYERCRYYEDSKAIYERAYRLQPQSRVTIYRLANVSIKLKDFDDASAYLEEYKEVAPYDSNVLVLSYRIRKGQGADVSELIDILEQLKEKDYLEKWAYELAVLYAESDQEEKCAKECDNIFLWFGEGRYVTKAMKLKSLFRTLTTEQDRFLREGSRKPAGSEEIMERADEALMETKRRQETFEKLQKEVSSVDTAQEDVEQKIRDMEDAREAALDASREAKAAELLNEAYEEEQREEVAAANDEDQEMIGETKIPTFNLPIMEMIKKQAWEKDNLKSFEPASEFNTPGTEFISVSEPEEEQIQVPEPEKDGIETIEEVRKKILSYVDETEDGLNLNDYDIPAEDEKQEPEESTVSEVITEPETEVQNTLKYTNMEDLLNHADEMKSDDLANSLAMILSGKVSQPEPEEEVQPESPDNSKGLYGVINRLWSRPNTKKTAGDSVYAEDPDLDNIEIRTEVPSRFDTLNLQKDLANSISDILNATEKSEIDKTIAVMDRNMLKNNISKYAAASEIHKESDETDWDAELMDVISEDTRKKIEEYELFETLEQEVDGQIKFNIEAENEVDDIPGQVNLEEYMQEQEKQQLEEAKVMAIKIAGEYMEQVSLAAPIIAKEEAEKYLADSQKELLEKARALMESTEPDQEEVESVMDSLNMLIVYANECVSQSMKVETPEKLVEDDKTEIEEVTEEVVVETEEVDTENIPEEVVSESVSEDVDCENAFEEDDDITSVENDSDSDSEEMEDAIAEKEITVGEESVEEEATVKSDTKTDLPVISEETLEMMNESKEAFMSSISDVKAKEIPGVDKKKADKQVIPMSDDQWEIMDYFMNVPEVESQIVNFVENQYDKFDNIIICGATGSGRASLALRLYKSIRLNNPQLPNQTLKVDADALNKKSVLKIYEKISSGIVLIEHAGLLNDIAAAELEKAMKEYEGKIFTIIIGNGERIGKLLEKNKELGEMCKYRFNIPEYNQDQYVEFAKSYAYSYGYVLDEMALLALYSNLSALKTKNKLITLQDVKIIVNEAILSSEKRLKKSFGGMFTKSKDKDGNIILKEKDFEL